MSNYKVKKSFKYNADNSKGYVAFIKSDNEAKNKAIMKTFKVGKISTIKEKLERFESSRFELMTKEYFDELPICIQSRLMLIPVDSVVELKKPKTIKITTRTPKKWIVIDTASAECYDHDLQYISKERKIELIKMLVDSLK